MMKKQIVRLAQAGARMKRIIILVILCAAYTGRLYAIPIVLTFHVFPFGDTMASGDSSTFFAVVVDDTGAPHHEFDTCIHWSILPSDTRNKLSATTGSQTTYYAIEGYQLNYIIASLTPPNNPEATLFDTVKIYIKPPGSTYRLWIEPDTNINPTNASAASLARLRNPMPVPLIYLADTNSTATVAGVVRDAYGNFVRFCRDAMWRTIGDTEVVRLSQPDKPYLCKIERTGWGNVKIVLYDGSLSVPDTVPVQIAGCCCMWRLRLVNAATGRPADSVVANPGQEITFKLQALSSCDTAAWVDIMGNWSIAPDSDLVYPVPPNGALSWTFSASLTGEYLLTVVFHQGAVQLDTIKVPISVRFANSILRNRLSSFGKKEKDLVEYYNLRGQKLQLYGMRHVDGIVLERIAAPSGNVTVRKRFQNLGSGGPMPQ
ncbi:MAG TPA: hypothetical protein VLX68_13045 [Chitinivibrionales bacterium]|nr:hypothetical protein [Chitinivibrionales bacterium]